MLPTFSRKMKCYFIFLFLFFLAFDASSAVAPCNGTPIETSGFHWTYTNTTYPQDEGYPRVIATGYVNEPKVFDFCWLTPMRLVGLMNAAIIGSYNGSDVYDIGLRDKDIGVVLYAGDAFDIDGLTKLSGNGLQVIHPHDGSFLLISNIGVSIKAELIAMGKKARGPIVMSRSKVGSLTTEHTDFDLSVSFKYLSDIIIDNINVNIKPATCNLNQTSYTVPLKTVNLSDFALTGSEVFAGDLTIPLQCGGATVEVYATMTDSLMPGNRSDILSIRSPGAEGIGLKIYAQGNTIPLSFGPDSSVKGNQNQWKVSSRGTVSPNVTLKVNYVRTGAIVAGSVDAISTITFSYQ
ncbi:fimbrial protein [Salmonella enterica subsp. enterica serovar Montevideo]|nr:fimbrial protein [Salmonella enterica subsp. enterica serovar Montevideo]